MLFYLAPMEGITGYIVRNAYAHYFPYIDKYFTPFIPAAKKMSKKIKRDLAAENNEQIRLVPQLIGNRADEFLMMIRQLEELGFTSVNLNFGCPSGTVVSKRKGAGFLADPKELEMLLEEVLEKSPLAVSVKTRVGIKDPDEWEALEQIHVPLCYNGDICSVEDYKKVTAAFPAIDRIMIGRGLLENPGLVGEIKGNPPADKARLRAFHDEILEGCLDTFRAEKDVVFHLKEIWFYLTKSFPDREKYLKLIRKCQSLPEYKLIVQQIFS